MSESTGIPTYTSAPVNSNQKEEDTTAVKPQPQPATAIESSITTAPQPATTSATATAPSYAPIYATTQNAPPLPGAAASLPTPTAAPQAPGNLTATPTTTVPSTTSQSPPAPQPGAFPTPGAGPTPTAPSSIPPPPKAGESISPLHSAPPPAGATQTPYTQSYAYQRHPSVSHGAVPNSTSTPYSTVYRDSSEGGSRPQGLPTYQSNSSGGGAGNIFPDEEPGLMNVAKGWMQSAGEKLAEVEAEVWKRINDAHGK
ncbi:hypothetical protein N7451_003456 [Penicillium sp. IBT 35674x]|nr:hypothetical protein N7451_003456 [Penicillium sp. IBT 35674x]